MRVGGNAEDCLVLRNDFTELGRLTDWLDGLGRQYGLPADRLFEIKTGLYEAVANVISYAYEDGAPHQIEVRVTVSSETVVSTVVDDGRPFNPLAAPPPVAATTVEEAEIGGRGILLMRSFSDGMQYERMTGRNHLTMVRCLPARA